MSELDYKPNSHKSKEKEQITEKKIKPVISGSVKTKKNLGRKLVDIFVAEDVESVKEYIIYDILVENVKKAILASIEAIFGYSSGRGASASKPSYKNYQKYYSNTSNNGVRNAQLFDFDDVIFQTRGDAECVLDSMIEIVDEYHVVSVGDFYDLAGISTPSYTVNGYGWTNLGGCKVMRVREGYVLKLPRPAPLN